MTVKATTPRMPRRAMVLAAGFGKRLRPITEETPKPLVPINGRSMLDTILDRLEAAGVEEVVVNLHHLGHKIEEHLADRQSPQIVFSPEPDILETGGGVRHALPTLGKEPFFAINGDVCWLDGRTPVLRRLAAAWDPAKMDALLLLHPSVYAHGYEGKTGDYMMDAGGKLRRRVAPEIAPFIYAGILILHPKLFADTPDGAFSLNLIFDRAEAAGRLYGLRHDGRWYHVGTPESLKDVEARLFDLTIRSGEK